jgi:hypothetical protein
MKYQLRFIAVAFWAMAATPPVHLQVDSLAYYLFLLLNSAAILCGLYLWNRP